jgi:hypothetical protein
MGWIVLSVLLDLISLHSAFCSRHGVDEKLAIRFLLLCMQKTTSMLAMSGTRLRRVSCNVDGIYRPPRKAVAARSFLFTLPMF